MIISAAKLRNYFETSTKISVFLQLSKKSCIFAAKNRINMNRRITTTLFLALCFLTGLQAQSLKQQGTSVEDLVPQDWTHDEVAGDLNKDGIADLVVNTKGILAIYFGNADGMLTLWRQYDQVLPVDENENCTHEITLEVTDRGVLKISTNLSCSAGGWGTYIDRYFYRYQNGDFFLIGKEEVEIRRNTGEVKTVSDNYLTWKRQVKTENFSDSTPPREKWSRIAKKPLEKLGDTVLP